MKKILLLMIFATLLRLTGWGQCPEPIDIMVDTSNTSIINVKWNISASSYSNIDYTVNLYKDNELLIVDYPLIKESNFNLGEPGNYKIEVQSNCYDNIDFNLIESSIISTKEFTKGGTQISSCPQPVSINFDWVAEPVVGIYWYLEDDSTSSYWKILIKDSNDNIIDESTSFYDDYAYNTYQLPIGTYYVNVQTVCNDSTSSNYATNSFDITEVQPTNCQTPILYVEEQYENSNNLDISWAGNSNYTKYELIIDSFPSNQQPTKSTGRIINFDADAYYYILNKYNKEYNYTFKLNAYCSDTTYAQPATASWPPPTVPTNLNATVNNETKSVSLSWDYIGSDTVYIKRFNDFNQSWENIANSTNGTNFTDIIETFGIYYYSVVIKGQDEWENYTYAEIKSCYASFSYYDYNSQAKASGYTIQFEPTGTSFDSYEWYFGDNSESSIKQSPTHVYTEGQYTVNLYAYNSVTKCEAKAEQTIIVGNFTPVTAGFTYKTDPNANTLIITNTAAQGAKKYYYDFGDGNVDTSANPQPHKYINSGWYYVCQYTSDADENYSDYFCEYIEVGKTDCNVFPSFSYTINDTAVTFTNYTFGAGSYYWTFGDGGTSKKAEPTYVYNQAGYYLVTLSVQDMEGSCSNSYSEYIQIGQMDCKANFDFFVDAETNTIKFTDKSKNATEYYWSFGNGNYSYDANALATYEKAGRYYVSLTISDAAYTCWDYMEKEIQVGTIACDARFTYFADSITKTITLNDKVVGKNVALYWDLGDGNYTEQHNPKHTYDQNGLYYVSLYTYDETTDCYDYYSENVMIGSMGSDCEAYFYYQVDPLTRKVHFTDESYGKINKRVWNFGDNKNYDAYTNSEVEYTYERDGYYDVCLTVTNTEGISNISCYPIWVGIDEVYNCEAKFIAVVDEATKTVKFSDQSVGDVATYQWNFGDDKTDTNKDATNKYANAGYYIAELHITTKAGCESWAYDYINVAAPDTFICNFIAKEDVSDKRKTSSYPVDFVGVGMGDNARLKWDFGDGTTDSTSMKPTHTYTEAKEYNVCYTVSDPITGDESKTCNKVKVGTLGNNINNANTAANSDFNIAPNPFINNLQLSITSKTAGYYTISITDVTGRIVKTINTLAAVGVTNMVLNGGNLQTGTYIVKIITPDNKILNKVVIKK